MASPRLHAVIPQGLHAPEDLLPEKRQAVFDLWRRACQEVRARGACEDYKEGDKDTRVLIEWIVWIGLSCMKRSDDLLNILLTFGIAWCSQRFRMKECCGLSRLIKIITHSQLKRAVFIKSVALIKSVASY